MRRLQRRIEKVEQAIIPKGRICLVFTRSGLEKEDLEKQYNEYSQRHGDRSNVLFVQLHGRDDPSLSYEDFIQKSRANCSPSNPLTSWWQYT